MEIKKHFGVYGVCLQDGKLLCIEKTRGPYQHRFDLPGGSQEAGEGLTETLYCHNNNILFHTLESSFTICLSMNGNLSSLPLSSTNSMFIFNL